MVAGVFHSGSGLGDQLFRYITVRTLAEAKGYEWSMLHPEHFKGGEFIKLPKLPFVYDIDSLHDPRWAKFYEKDVRENGIDIRSYDPEINFVEDNTVIDGSFEDDKYWRHNLDDIAKWLAVEPLYMKPDVCVVGFRGGEYAAQADLFLRSEYYSGARLCVAAHRNKDSEYPKWKQTRFEVHTDDPYLAKTFFPSDFKIIDNEPISHSKHTNMGFNWRSARYAKYAIIPNSAFFILPRILKHHEDPSAITIAPRYWARHNKQIWARPACYYPEFTYI